MWLADGGAGSGAEPDGIDTAAADAALERTALDGAVVLLSLPKASAEDAPPRALPHPSAAG